MRARFFVQRAFAILLAAFFLGLPSLWADILHTRDGRTLQGKVLKEAGSYRVVGTYGEARVAIEDVESIEWDADLRAEYRHRDAALGKSGHEARIALAAWCRARGLDAEADRQIQRILDEDPENARAHAWRGEVRQGDRWVPRAEAARAEGRIFYKGAWRTKEDVETLQTAQEEKEARRAVLKDAYRRRRTAALRNEWESRYATDEDRGELVLGVVPARKRYRQTPYTGYGYYGDGRQSLLYDYLLPYAVMNRCRSHTPYSPYTYGTNFTFGYAWKNGSIQLRYP